MRPATVLAIAVVAVLGAAGCGGKSTTSDEFVRTGPSKTRPTAAGQLTSTPDPLTVADVRKQPEDSPERAVMQLFFSAQWGDLPAIVDTYDPRIVATVGVSRITAGYTLLRPSLLTARPRIVQVVESQRDPLVTVELANVSGAPLKEGFVVHRTDGTWRIVYDTLLERGISNAVAAQVSGGAPKPGPDARRAGDRAAQAYRDAYPSLQLVERELTKPPKPK